MTQWQRLVRKTRALPLWLYCFVTGLFAFAGSILLVGTSWGVGKALGLDITPAPVTEPLGWAAVFGTVIFAPAVETLLLIGFLKLLARTGLRESVACGVSALMWGLAHGLLHPLRFFGSVWSFFLFGVSYLSWRHASGSRGFVAAAAPHALVNSLALGLVHVGGA